MPPSLPPKILKITKVPTDDLSLCNRAIVNSKEPFLEGKQVTIEPSRGHKYVMTLEGHPGVPADSIGFALPQRQWAKLTIGQQVTVTPFVVDRNSHFLASISVEADFQNKKNVTTEPYDTVKMRTEFLGQFMQQAFTVGEALLFQFENKKLLTLTVKSLEVLDFSNSGKPCEAAFGVTYNNTDIVFDKVENSSINLIGKAKGKSASHSIINPDWNFGKMGIGGLDKEFSSIFRRAFASRVFPPEVVDQLGMKHCRGILLFGPPGTGKTLMARQIGKMLNAREPKIVNGPQILDKYVGESEANVRKLFADAEEEEARLGPNSGLHIIIFDEIDAICKARGSVAGSTAVHDTVVNQLLSKIDGVDQLNNILVIGMTNRKDMIDDALLRPGRLEVQMEIGLPDEGGRVQILNIHMCKLMENKKLAADVSIADLAVNTKNFSGAEIEGLVRAAASTAMNRLVKAETKVQIDPNAVEKLQVTMADFRSALENDIKPAFGTREEEILQYCPNGIIRWGETVNKVLEDGQLLVQQAKYSEKSPLITVILSGPPSSGKTALAATIAQESGFPFVKMCSPESMVGYHESAKCQLIKKVFDDAYKSPFSCIILDDIERLIDYVSLGPRFSNLVLQALLVLLKKPPPKGRRLLVLGTSSQREMLQDVQMLPCFTTHIHVSNLNSDDHLITAIRDLEALDDNQMKELHRNLNGKRCWIGIKRLIAIVEMAKQTEKFNQLFKLQCLLEDEGGLEMKASEMD